MKIRKFRLFLCCVAAFSKILMGGDSASFEAVKDKIVIIQCDDSTGSGFTCEMDGKRYLFTNKHVISGQKRVVAFFPDGEKLEFGQMEIAKNADLVRFVEMSE